MWHTYDCGVYETWVHLLGNVKDILSFPKYFSSTMYWNFWLWVEEGIQSIEKGQKWREWRNQELNIRQLVCSEENSKINPYCYCLYFKKAVRWVKPPCLLFCIPFFLLLYLISEAASAVAATVEAVRTATRHQGIRTPLWNSFVSWIIAVSKIITKAPATNNNKQILCCD